MTAFLAGQEIGQGYDMVDQVQATEGHRGSMEVNERAWELLSAALFTEGKARAPEYYAQLHEMGDEFLTPDGTHIVIGYEAVDDMMRSPQFLKNNARGASHDTIAFSDLTAEQEQELARWADEAALLGALDPPDHTRIRGLVQRTFMPKHVMGLQGKIREEIGRLLAGVDPTRPVDIYSQFGALFAPEIVAELIGLPSDDRAYVSDLTHAFMRGFDPGADFATRLASAKAGYEQRQYVRKVVADRRANPRDDLVTALTHASQDVLSEGELVQLLTVLYLGGYGTTAHMIGNGLVALLRNPDQLRLLQSDLDNYLRPALDEILRFDGSIGLTQLYPVEGALLRGKPTEANATYLGLLPAANRDPKVFDQPDRFRIDRERRPIMTFGGGPHVCLGINLARVELELVFRELLTGYPNMQLADPNPPRMATFMQQTYDEVMILLEP